MHGSFAELRERRAKKFADETPAQRAQHREAAWREKKQQEQKPQTPIWLLFPRLRKRELERIFKFRWCGRSLPDDDAGRGDLRLMADHLAQLSKNHVAAWASLWAPWLSAEATDALIEQVGVGKYWTAAALGKELNLDDATRTRLDIRTIQPVDSDKALRLERRKAKKVAQRRARRAALRAQRRPTASETKPWLAFGKGRAWWPDAATLIGRLLRAHGEAVRDGRAAAAMPVQVAVEQQVFNLDHPPPVHAEPEKRLGPPIMASVPPTQFERVDRGPGFTLPIPTLKAV